MVDSSISAHVNTDSENETPPATFDFKSQVQQFIEFDQKRWRLPGRHSTGDEQTIFTVLFGTWDLLQYSAMDKDASQHAIECSVRELFHNLNLLADYVGNPKIAVPNLLDVTFLPRYAGRKNGTTANFAQKQHQSVFLWTYWNTALSHEASKWDRGDLFVPNVHDIVMQEVRAKQMHSANVADSKGVGKQAPLFQEVVEPCLVQVTDAITGTLQAATQTCTDPSSHLFW